MQIQLLVQEAPYTDHCCLAGQAAGASLPSYAFPHQ